MRLRPWRRYSGELLRRGGVRKGDGLYMSYFHTYLLQHMDLEKVDWLLMPHFSCIVRRNNLPVNNK